MSRPAALVCAALALVACKDHRRDDAPAAASPPATGPTARGRELIADLHAGGSRARSAIGHIEALSRKQALKEAEGEAILRALPSLPAPAEGDDDPQRLVLRGLSQYLLYAWLPTLEELAGELRLDGRLALMEILAGNDDPQPMAAFVRILGEFPEPAPTAAFELLRDLTHQGDALFPALLALLDREPLDFEIVLTALLYAEEEALPDGVLAAYAEQLLARYDAALATVAPAQQPRGVAWRFAEAYATPRAHAALLLDLMGALPAALVEGRLSRALRLQDPRLVSFAIESWLDLGRAPPAAALERVFASDETRSMLWRELKARGQLALVPARWRTQEALAASVFTRWLILESDFAVAPDQLEPLGRVSFDAGPPDGLVDTYVFRFRVAGEAWLAGWAGGFLRRDGLTTEHHGGTGSDFQEAGDRAAADIFDPVDALARWRKYRLDEPAPAEAAPPDAGVAPAPVSDGR